MLKIFACLAIAALQATQIQSCEKHTFNNAVLTASKYFSFTDQPDDIRITDTLTGCITPTEQLKDAAQITVTNQTVPILFEGAVQDLQMLLVLTLEQNGIEELKPGAFKNLSKIATISLAKNRLKNIPEGVFNDMEVRTLLLNDNGVTTVASGAFDNMPNLVRIYLDHNNLTEWDSNWFTNSSNIRILSATVNQITALPEGAFQNFKGKHDVENASVSTRIYLAENEIQEVHPRAFMGLKQLEFLDLYKNKIAELDSSVFVGFENITYLVLARNKITCLKEDFLDTLPATEVFAIDDNPLDCKCLKNMQYWAKKHEVSIKFATRAAECSRR